MRHSKLPGCAGAHGLWRGYVNPDFVGLLEALDYGRDFRRARGASLFDEGGREYLDFLSGYGVHNAGHNHPRVVAALKAALDSDGPSMLNMDAPVAAGLLARRLSGLTHPSLCRAVFANSGAEAVEAALKLARLATGRAGVVSCAKGFHGLSAGTLPLLPPELVPESLRAGAYKQVPFGDLPALEEACRSFRPAAFIAEPVQGEGGVRAPADGYLAGAGRICRETGTVFVVDEIQTGLGRTGRLFATPLAEARPDALLVGKALSGGLVPVSAALCSEELWSRVKDPSDRQLLHPSTFAGGRLAMEAGLAVLDVIEAEKLPERAEALGRELGAGLEELRARHKVIAEVRGRGLFWGVEFRKPEGLLPKTVPAWIRERLFENVVSARLLAEHAVIAQPCYLAPGVLRAEPPLTVTSGEISRFLAALDECLSALPDYGAAARSALLTRLAGVLP